MTGFEQIEVDGKLYYYDGKNFIDDCFIVVQGAELHKVAAAYLGNVNHEKLNAEELYQYAKNLKLYGLSAKAKEVMLYGMDKFDENDRFIYKILPIYTSCCREIGVPMEAVKKAESYMPRIEPSVLLCTSLAAACCDIKKYDYAKRYARMAYAKQGGGQGYKSELSLVFLRLKKETGEVLFDDE